MYILAGFAELASSRSAGLVLEADAVSRDALLTLLAAGGYPAEGCSTTDEALASLERGRQRVLIIARPPSLEEGWHWLGAFDENTPTSASCCSRPTRRPSRRSWRCRRGCATS